jgi:hypothetical protein
MRVQTLFAAVVIAWCLSAEAGKAHAQNFFGGNNTAFDPEISIVESGAKLDVTATVSADRKYVTMTMQPQVATLINMRTFTFQGPGGVVGFNNPGHLPGPHRVDPRTPNVGNRPRGPLMPALANPRPTGLPPVLLREGMTRLSSPAPTTQPADSAVPLEAGRDLPTGSSSGR